ncbi:MAG: M48 family metallopeptidase [Ignavibacteriae bacterium]|nr:M48 family metallopeptidase [Ignavibacteriota bacterium]
MLPGINLNIVRRKVKNIRIKVTHDKEVHVVIPLRYPLHRLKPLLENRSEWINKKIEYFDRLKSELFRLDEKEILYIGERYLFVLKPEMKNTFLVDEEAKKIYSGVNLLEKDMQEHWLKQEAKRVISERINVINKDGRFSYNRIFVRSQKTKWGNCSSNKNISFNWRLIKAPMEIIDYLIVHEFTHLDEMNHSPEFWRKVSLVYPEYRNADKWLKKFGAGLFY